MPRISSTTINGAREALGQISASDSRVTDTRGSNFSADLRRGAFDEPGSRSVEPVRTVTLPVGRESVVTTAGSSGEVIRESLSTGDDRRGEQDEADSSRVAAVSVDNSVRSETTASAAGGGDLPPRQPPAARSDREPESDEEERKQAARRRVELRIANRIAPTPNNPFPNQELLGRPLDEQGDDRLRQNQEFGELYTDLRTAQFDRGGVEFALDALRIDSSWRNRILGIMYPSVPTRAEAATIPQPLAPDRQPVAGEQGELRPPEQAGGESPAEAGPPRRSFDDILDSLGEGRNLRLENGQGVDITNAILIEGQGSAAFDELRALLDGPSLSGIQAQLRYEILKARNADNPYPNEADLVSNFHLLDSAQPGFRAVVSNQSSGDVSIRSDETEATAAATQPPEAQQPAVVSAEAEGPSTSSQAAETRLPVGATSEANSAPSPETRQATPDMVLAVSLTMQLFPPGTPITELPRAQVLERLRTPQRSPEMPGNDLTEATLARAFPDQASLARNLINLINNGRVAPIGELLIGFDPGLRDEIFRGLRRPQQLLVLDSLQELYQSIQDRPDAYAHPGQLGPRLATWIREHGGGVPGALESDRTATGVEPQRGGAGQAESRQSGTRVNDRVLGFIPRSMVSWMPGVGRGGQDTVSPSSTEAVVGTTVDQIVDQTPVTVDQAEAIAQARRTAEGNTPPEAPPSTPETPLPPLPEEANRALEALRTTLEAIAAEPNNPRLDVDPESVFTTINFLSGRPEMQALQAQAREAIRSSTNVQDLLEDYIYDNWELAQDSAEPEEADEIRGSLVGVSNFLDLGTTIPHLAPVITQIESEITPTPPAAT